MKNTTIIIPVVTASLCISTVIGLMLWELVPAALNGDVTALIIILMIITYCATVTVLINLLFKK